jgi:phage terminase small subunit
MARRDTLANRERLFVREYLIDLNARQASIRAGYSPRSSTHGLVSRPRVKAAIESAMAARAAALDITAERVLYEIALMGFANLMDYFTPQADGTAHVDLSGLTREQAAGIAAVEVDEFKSGRGAAGREVKRVKVKLADKKGSLELIGKHLGLFARKPGEGTANGAEGNSGNVRLSDDELLQKILSRLLNEQKSGTDAAGS